MTDKNTEPERVRPREAVELPLETRKVDLSETTHVTHGYRLNPFVRWCEEVREVEAMSTWNSPHLHEYRLWRRDEGDLKPVSLSTLRVFLEFRDDLERIRPERRDKVRMPTVPKADNQRDEMLESAEAARLLDYLERCEYASLNHALSLLLWHTGMRSEAAHSHDVEDFSWQYGWVELRHRPDEVTTLKNAERGDRYVEPSSKVVMVLNDYIDHNYHDVTDDHGREPLFTPAQGKASVAILSRRYRRTRRVKPGGVPSNQLPTGRLITSSCPSV